MSGPITPTICGPQPGYGLRVRCDGNRALAVADVDCRCGQLAASATGALEVQQLVVRAERHMRDDCPIPEVRRAAAFRDAARRRAQHRR
ncbi:hypothetical protein [Streptomyces chumphonensis]|uniref:hypothetical protein n=1 Tax=Streptomyces chumphonensis TaxID=1214925 RepID=UPI003D74E680